MSFVEYNLESPAAYIMDTRLYNKLFGNDEWREDKRPRTVEDFLKINLYKCYSHKAECCEHWGTGIGEVSLVTISRLQKKVISDLDLAIKNKSEYIMKPISDLCLFRDDVYILQKNGVNTIGDFLQLGIADFNTMVKNRAGHYNRKYFSTSDINGLLCYQQDIKNRLGEDTPDLRFVTTLDRGSGPIIYKDMQVNNVKDEWDGLVKTDISTMSFSILSTPIEIGENIHEYKTAVKILIGIILGNMKCHYPQILDDDKAITIKHVGYSKDKSCIDVIVNHTLSKNNESTLSLKFGAPIIPGIEGLEKFNGTYWEIEW